MCPEIQKKGSYVEYKLRIEFGAEEYIQIHKPYAVVSHFHSEVGRKKMKISCFQRERFYMKNVYQIQR